MDWTLGQPPLRPSSMPSFEVGMGGAGTEGSYTPLMDGEGLGHGTEGWGLGLQGHYGRGGWSVSGTVLALRDHGRSLGILQRAAIAYESDSGWRAALEQTPLAWGPGLNGGDLLGDAARPFPRLTLATPEATLALGRWHAEAFTGWLERRPPIPEWIPDREARIAARTAGLDLQKPLLSGFLVRATFGVLVEATFGAITLHGGHDDEGHPAPSHSARTESLAELRIRVPGLLQLLHARGASMYISRCGAPDSAALSLVPARNLGGMQLVWNGWDLGLEYAWAASPSAGPGFSQPAYLAGFSTHGDPLGATFGSAAITRTMELGLPLFQEGQGRVKVVRATASSNLPTGTGTWFLQGDAQWRTSTGRVGASVASSRNEAPGSEIHWGWAFSVFQAFRVF